MVKPGSLSGCSGHGTTAYFGVSGDSPAGRIITRCEGVGRLQHRCQSIIASTCSGPNQLHSIRIASRSPGTRRKSTETDTRIENPTRTPYVTLHFLLSCTGLLGIAHPKSPHCNSVVTHGHSSPDLQILKHPPWATKAQRWRPLRVHTYAVSTQNRAVEHDVTAE